MAAQVGTVLDDTAAGLVAVGDRHMRRLGFGAMRIAQARNPQGERDRGLSAALVLGARDRGVQFFDTANIYGFGTCEEILAEALAPYPDDILVATKAGFRAGTLAPGQQMLRPAGRPEDIRAECEGSLRRLRLDCIDLYQIHVPDPDVPWADTVGAFAELRQAGKVRMVGLSNVSLGQLREAQAIVPVVSVQNRYSVGDRRSEQVLDACEHDGIVFLPWAPVVGVQGRPVASVVADIAASRQVPDQQVALAWLLQRSPVMLPIPGTSQLAHLNENIDAAWLRLSGEELARLGAAAR